MPITIKLYKHEIEVLKEHLEVQDEILYDCYGEDNSKEERKEEGGENFGGRRSGRPWAQNKCKRQRS